MDHKAFYYVDGTPTKGKWIDLEFIDNTDEILEELATANIIHRNEDGELEYGGDLLVSDVDGDLVSAFHGKYDTFNLDDFTDARDRLKSDDEMEAAAKWIDYCGTWDYSDFRDNYRGHYDSEQDFAQELEEETGSLSDVPEHLRGYIDWESYARDLFTNGYVFLDGYVFDSN